MPTTGTFWKRVAPDESGGEKTSAEGAPGILLPAKGTLKGVPSTLHRAKSLPESASGTLSRLPSPADPAKDIVEGVPNTLCGAKSPLGDAPGILRFAFSPLLIKNTEPGGLS